MILTTGYEIQDHKILQYKGIVSGECALGTGFLSSFGAGIADILGTNSTMYSDKLRSAKEHALRAMKDEADRLRADAIIGIDINYTTFSADIMGVIATGTAVKIEKVQGAEMNLHENSQMKEQRYPVKRTNVNDPFRVKSLIIEDSSEYLLAGLDLYFGTENLELKGIKASITFRDIFGDEQKVENVCFVRFNKSGKYRVYADKVLISVKSKIVEVLESVDFIIEKYVIGKEIRTAGNEIISDATLEIEEGASGVDTPDAEQILDDIAQLKNAMEMKEHMMELNTKYPDYFSDEMLLKMDERIKFERLYGPSKNKTLQLLRDYLENA